MKKEMRINLSVYSFLSLQNTARVKSYSVPGLVAFFYIIDIGGEKRSVGEN